MLCVEDERDFDRAKQIVDEELNRLDNVGQNWVCRNCGESIEDQFTDCWKCGAPRDE